MGLSLTMNWCYVMFCYGVEDRISGFSPSLEGRFLVI